MRSYQIFKRILLCRERL